MSTSNLVARYERLPLDWLKHKSLEDAAEVSVRRSVNADRSRLFQALTIAEYIDAWIVVPGAVPGSTSVAMGQHGFVVRYALPNGTEERFVASYKLLRRGKVQFAWRRQTLCDADPSLVRIRLEGDFGRTTVLVTHVGLDESEQAQYRMLWEASLEKLASLF